MNMINHERVLIGSSNVANFYKKSDFSEYPDYRMIKSTRFETFKAQMLKLERSNKLVVISVIENFLSDAARKGEAENVENYEVNFNEIISSAIQEFVTVVKDNAIRLPETTFLLVKPILRPSLNWFDLNFDEICADLKEKISKVGLNNVSEIESLSRASQNFATDGVHLTNESGRLFVDCIISSAEAHYNAGPVIDLEEEEDDLMETNQIAPTIDSRTSVRTIPLQAVQDQSSKELGPRIERVELGLKKLEAEFKLKAWKDCLMTAKLREDVDFMTNVKNEDRIVLTGLTATTPPPIIQEEKIAWIRNIVKEFIKTIDPEICEKITFVKQGRSKDKDIPMAEVRLETKEIASSLRKKFVDLRKSGRDFGRVYMANCVTLATRVRVDILKSIVKQFTGKDDLEMYVAAYTSRPVLKIKNTKTQNTSVHTFTDAILKFGKKIDLNNLDDAYRRAGRAFTGNMEQNFVVLTDNRKIPTPAPLAGPSGLTKKRPLEDQQSVYNRTKGPRFERGGKRGGNGTAMFRGRGMAGGSNNATPKN
jgi:hypothetical protein